MAEKDTLLTVEGKARLEEELELLSNQKRAEISERIKVAREFGDLSENSEYEDAKKEQAINEARITEITGILAEATVLSGPVSVDEIGIGATVDLEIDGKATTLEIVGGVESEPLLGKISEDSPVGKALKGKKKGDKTEAIGPAGNVIKLSVKKIVYHGFGAARK